MITHKARVGAILKDENGDVLMAASKIINEVNDLETIELLPMLRSLLYVGSFLKMMLPLLVNPYHHQTITF